MMPVKHLSLAVIGDEDLVNLLRLAGISRYYLIKEEGDAGEQVRQALNELIAAPDVGVVVMLESYVEPVADLIDQIKEGKQITPVIIEIPSKYGTRYRDIKQYYKAYIQGFIGVNVEI